MQKILGGVGLLVLLAALAGGVYLSQKSQETRRGAAGGNGVVLFTPTEKNFRVGELLESTVILDVAGLGVSGATGLLGAEVNVAYDKNVVRYEAIEPLSGYELMIDKIADAGTGINLSLVFTKTTAEPNGSVQLAKLKFRALKPGGVNLKVTGVFTLVKSAATEVAKVTVTEERNAIAGYVVLGDASPTVEPSNNCLSDTDCSLGQRCVSGLCRSGTATPPTSITPTLTPTPTPTTVPTITPLSCGGRCYGDADCATGYTCFPVGMDRCEGISWPTVKKFTSGERLNTLEMADIRRRCPDSVAIVNNIVADPERMVGQCRKEECVTDKSCACLSNTCEIDSDCPSDRRCLNRVCLLKTVSEDIVSLSMSGVSQAVVDQPFVVTIKYNTGDLNKKVSGLKMTFNVPSGSFKILSNVINSDFKGTGSSTLVTGDGMTSGVEFNLVSLKAFGELKSGGVAAEIKIMPLASGVFAGSGNGVIRLFTTEVVGKTISGGSVSYPAPREINLPVTVVSGPTLSADICRFCPGGERLVGNANCDNSVSMLDFEVWRSAMFDGTPLSQMAMADMDCTGDVKMLDFEVWRSAYFDKLYTNQ